jgi:hypothetical protein
LLIMATLYNRYLTMIQTQQTRDMVRRNSGRVDMVSPFVQRLADEAEYSLILLGSLPYAIQAHSERLRSQAVERRSLFEKAKTRRDELLGFKAQLEAELAAFTWWAKVDDVAAVVGRHMAVKLLIGKIPIEQLQREAPSSKEVLEAIAAYQDEQCANLQRWIARLSSAQQQIASEIDEIEGDFEPHTSSPLAPELASVMLALDEAQSVLKLIEPKHRTSQQPADA